MRFKSFLIILLFIAVALAVFFYLENIRQIIINIQKPPTDSHQNTGKPELIENNATSTPYELPAGEISHGNTNKKQIIFTFDCGAGTNSADKILEVAKKHNLKLTFFMTGKFAEKYPDLVRKMAIAGHEIFNHTYSHPHLPQISDEEIKQELSKTDEIISKLTGTTTKPFFRPPFGERNQKVLDVAYGAGFQSVFWTIDALDWMTDKTEQDVKTQIYGKLKPGTIILMHVGDDITGNILDEVFTKLELENDGYKIVNLTEGIQ